MKSNNLRNQSIDYVFKMGVRFFYILFWILFLAGFISLSHLSHYFRSERSLSICMWSDKIDESILQQFEQQTGIKIYTSYYESNEELLTKFEITKNLNCDIALPSDYIVKNLVNSGLLKKIDKSRCDFINRIYPEFLHLDFDSENEYSLPLYWDVFGIGYRKSYFPQGLPTTSWALIFDEQMVPCKQISMVDDSRESIFIAHKYLHLDQQSAQENLSEITKLFLTQKKWVGAYTDFQQGYFLNSQTYPLVVSFREHVARQSVTSDDIGFIVPDEGTILMIINIVISATSQKDDLIYEFLNFIYTYQVMMFNCKEHCLLPATQDVLEELPIKYIGMEDLYPRQDVFKRLESFSNILTEKQIHDLWVAFKSF